MGEQIKARSGVRARVDADGSSPKVVTGHGAAAYYGDQNVSAGSNLGTLSPGQSVTVEQTRFFLTQGVSTNLFVADSEDRSMPGLNDRMDDVEVALDRLEAGGDVLGRDGGPQQAAPWVQRQPQWFPSSGPAIVSDATSFIFDPADALDVLERGGQLSTITADYWAPGTDRAELVAGPFARAAVGEKDTALGGILIPAVGLIDPANFTVQFLAKPKGAAGSAQSGNALLWIGSNQANNGLVIYKAVGTAVLNARIYSQAVPSSELAITLAGGDMPADEWTAITLTLSGTTLTLRVGNNVKNNAATVTPLPSWAFEAGGSYLALLTDAAFTGLSGDWEIAELHITRARVPGTADLIEAPAIHADFDDDDGDVELPDLAGLFAQYPGWRDTEEDGQTGGGGPGVTGNAIRDAIFETIAADGCKLARVDHLTGKILGTVGAPDYSLLEEPMDALHAAGMKFHGNLNGTPEALRGGGGENAVPTSNADFATMASNLVTWMKGKGYDFFLLGWNEPVLSNFWDGTAAQLSALDLVVQAKLTTDHPDIEYGSADDNFVPASGATNPTNKVVLDRDANSRALPFMGFHDYAEEYESAVLIAAGRAYVDANTDYGADVPIRVGEWAANSTAMNLWANASAANSDNLTFSRGHPMGVRQTALCFRKVANYAEANVLSAVMTRMGILDAFFTGIEQMLGAFSHDNPPRPLSPYPALQSIWKCAGQRVTATVNRSRLKALASKTDNGVCTVAYGSARAWDAQKVEWQAFDLDGLPEEFTWKQWRFDHRDGVSGAPDCRLALVGEGDETNLPLGADLTGEGVGVLQITPP